MSSTVHLGTVRIIDLGKSGLVSYGTQGSERQYGFFLSPLVTLFSKEDLSNRASLIANNMLLGLRGCCSYGTRVVAMEIW